jgi:hypothetical protein
VVVLSGVVARICQAFRMRFSAVKRWLAGGMRCRSM